ncbi:MAG TPA: hypothetical protein VN260_10720 [Dissulfurispiraceae bacterium]|nr:hypothetical protein [Dissulfurispiraceae bacterium]
MRRSPNVILLMICFIPLCLLSPEPENAGAAEPFQLSSSTQYLWGDDLLGESQSIVAQYLRLSYKPEGKPFSFTGYGRIWQDFGDGAVRSDDFSGRLYYLFMEYTPTRTISLRLGRQFMAFTAGNAVLDGLRVDFHEIGPIGITAAAGRDVIFSLDSEHTRNGNNFFGIDVHLERIRNIQLGLSFVLRHDQWERSRQEYGMNFRYNYKFLSPYAEVRYDWLSETFDEATFGIDLFPLSGLLFKLEFYHSYPTFDSTSIYSVFAVDKYQEYLIHGEYSFDVPVTVYASYARQTYESSDNADRFTVGSRFYPVKNLMVNASIDYRNGYGGRLWGFELTGNYRLIDKLLIAAGIQYDVYRRPEDDGSNFARRYWIGGEWLINKATSLAARIEDNVNENFEHRPLGRIALNWNL